MAVQLQEAFHDIGAYLADETLGRIFEIDVVTHDGREAYQLQRPFNDALFVEVLDVKPRKRHLVLDVTGRRLPIAGRYLCGHDEFHWFVASLPFSRQTQSVGGAMEALKPPLVRREQRRRGVNHRRDRRRTAAYVRQGEWFFLPRPKMQAAEALAERNGQLVRPGGTPHRVDWLFRAPGRDEVFVRGDVRHPDHATIHLDVWHRVVRNNEPAPAPVQQPFQRMAYLD